MSDTYIHFSSIKTYNKCCSQDGVRSETRLNDRVKKSDKLLG